MPPQPSYKPTMFDRFGPDAARYLAAFKYGLITFGFSTLMFFTVGYEVYGFSEPVLVLYTLNCSCTLSAISMLVGLGLGDTAGVGAEHVYMGGSSTPYEDDFSQEQALVMQRDYQGALHLYEQKILQTPKSVKLLVAAADLYGTLGEDPKRAAELYKEVQRMNDVTQGQDIYVSNKLADLYLGKLKAPGKALVEFRRLMTRYPGTVTEKHAKSAIDNLKPDLLRDPEAPPPKPESRVW